MFVMWIEGNARIDLLELPADEAQYLIAMREQFYAQEEDE